VAPLGTGARADNGGVVAGRPALASPEPNVPRADIFVHAAVDLRGHRVARMTRAGADPNSPRGDRTKGGIMGATRTRRLLGSALVVLSVAGLASSPTEAAEAVKENL